MQENPTAANVLVADIRSDSPVAAEYQFLANAPEAILAESPDDQRFGDWVQQVNPAIGNYATGTRNPYGVRVGQFGNVILTINGPNFRFGASMEGVDGDLEAIQGPDPETEDALFVQLQQVRTWPGNRFVLC